MSEHKTTDAARELSRLATLRPRAEWHEDHGPVLWHHLDQHGRICEAPIVARDDGELEDAEAWPDYFTHWSPLPYVNHLPEAAHASEA
ncbi:hypothetical protein [Falsiroseomonas sp. CW058]|uniref:hypothetical protein n=1 Tax=Falsiroseomonas sp. CW058 TaxID=3388664 RepID=UPI003D311FEB